MVSKVKQLAGGVIAGAIIIAVMSLTACGPSSVQELSGAIVKTGVAETGTGKRLEVTHAMKSILSEKTWLFEVSSDLKDITRGIVENWPDDYDEVFFFVHAPVQDQYGREDTAQVMQISWVVDDLKKVNWSNMTNWQLLGLAKDVQFKPLGRRLATAFCEDPDNARYAGRFCLRVM